MRRFTPNPRGMALVMAMIVVVLITLLVAGAISFTGTERAASEVQTQEDAMSSCVQAARNLFLSKLNTIDKDMPKRIVIEAELPVRVNDDPAPNTVHTTKLRTGHFDTPADDHRRRRVRQDEGPLPQRPRHVQPRHRHRSGEVLRRHHRVP